MSESAPSREPVTAEAAVKAYVRMNRARLTADGELLALLLPGRFMPGNIADLQRYTIEKLKSENAALRSENEVLKTSADSGAKLSAGVRRVILDLLGARSLGEVVEAANSAAVVFGAERAILCLEGEGSSASDAVRLIAPGTVTAVVGPGGMGAILSGGGELLFGCSGFRSLAAFRLRLGRHADALYVLGSPQDGCFERCEAELGWFARALERAIRAWLDLPKA